MRLGVFGGSFDPVHLGHLILVEMCCDALRLDHVLFMVANRSPLKADKKPADNADRLAMVSLAIAGNSSFRLDPRETKRDGVSYTVDTIRELRNEQPNAELFFLMGADSLVDIAKWRQPEQLFEMAMPAVISRGGVGAPNWESLRPFMSEARFDAAQNCVVPSPQVEISSADIRQRIAEGRSIRYLVPAAVEAYLREHRLYTR